MGLTPFKTEGVRDEDGDLMVVERLLFHTILKTTHCDRGGLESRLKFGGVRCDRFEQCCPQAVRIAEFERKRIDPYRHVAREFERAD